MVLQLTPIKSEILVDSEADTKTGTVSIDANNTLNIESKDKTTFNSPNVTKTVTTEADEVGTLTETFTTEHTETANKLNIYAGSSNLTPDSHDSATLTVESNYKNEAIHGDTEHSYINVDEIVVDKTVTEGTSDAKVVRTTYTSSDINTSELYDLHAGSSNPSDATLTVESNHKENGVHTEHSYINVDKIVVDKTVNEGIKTDRVDRNVFATTDTTDVS